MAGEIIKSINAPGSDPEGLTFDGMYLWHSDTGTNLIYQISPSSGTAIKSISAPGTPVFSLGFDGKYLFAYWGVHPFYNISTLDRNGVEVRRIAFVPGFPYGGGYYGIYHIYLLNVGGGATGKLNRDGVAVRLGLLPGALGITYDGVFFYETTLTSINQLREDFTIIRTITPPSNFTRDITFDRKNLWVVDDTAQAGKIHCIAR